MAQTQLRGNTQIMAGTLTAALLVANFNLPTTQLQDGALFLKRDGTVPLSAALNFGGFAATNVGNGVNPSDAVNMSQLSAVANGYGTKGGADTVSLTNVAALTGLQTINGVTLTDGDIAFLPNQTTGTQNGPWVARATAWTRPVWYTGTTPSEGAYIVIERGTYAGYSFILSTQGTITVDTTVTSWVTVPTAATPTSGNGITIAGNQIAVRNGNGLTFDGATALALNLNGSSLNLSAAGVKITDAASPGQVMIGNGTNAATFATLSGDVSTVSGTGVVALLPAIRRSNSFVWNEAPGGVMNGTNTTFTLASTPVTGSLQLYYNLGRLYPGTGNDYTISAGTITMLFPVFAGDRLVADYQV